MKQRGLFSMRVEKIALISVGLHPIRKICARCRKRAEWGWAKMKRGRTGSGAHRLAMKPSWSMILAA